MNIDQIQVMEHLALQSSLHLEEMCNLLRVGLHLPAFNYDAENETEWGRVEVDHVEINVSRPYEPGTLQKWDDTVSNSCNFGITLIVSREHRDCTGSEWSLKHLVPKYAQQIVNITGIEIYHHRTWIGAGRNIQRTGIFQPES